MRARFNKIYQHVIKSLQMMQLIKSAEPEQTVEVLPSDNIAPLTAHLSPHDRLVLTKWYRDKISGSKGTMGSSVTLYMSLQEHILVLLSREEIIDEIIVNRADMEVFLFSQGHQHMDVEGERYFYGIDVTQETETFKWSPSVNLRS